MTKTNRLKTTLQLIIFITFIASIASSCKKGSAGGEVTLTLLPQHHGTPIKGTKIYVKFNTYEYPQDITTNYDIKIEGKSDEEYVSIEGLRYGNYFLFIEGYDSLISAPVSTPVAIKINWSERKKEKKLIIPVAE